MIGKKLGYIFLVIIIVIVAYNVINALSHNSLSDSISTQDNSDLKASVKSGPDGLYITNNESIAWTDCMVGLNGGNGFGFDNPPYQTQNLLSFQPGQMTLVPFGKITTSDGTIFDPTTHTINSAVIECFRGTGNLRDWIGGGK